MAMRQMRDGGENRTAWLVMLVTPLFFSSNLIFGRWTVPEVAPATLAFVRWGIVALVLLPFALRVRGAEVPWARVGLLGFLGMVVCGGIVYLALQVTTATNATLIYTSSPVFVLLIERLRGVPLTARKALGCAVAMIGIAVILFRGSLEALAAFRLNRGDALILACAIAWAFYSIVFRDERLGRLPAAAVFGLVAGLGALQLLPFSVAEWAAGQPMPTTARAWVGIAGIVVSASLIAFGGYQFGLRHLGAQRTSVFMYLLPVYGVLLAVTFLGEAFRPFHAVGIVLVLGGVVLATRPSASS